MSSASTRPSTENQPESQPTSVRDEIQRLLKAGIMFFNDNQDGHALPMFKKAYMLSRSIPEPHLQAKCLFNLGATYITTGKPQKALKCLWKAQEAGAGEKDGDLYFNIGAAYDNLKEYSKAAAYYRKAVHEYHVGQPASVADALIKMAYCLVSTGELGSAAHSFHQAGHVYRKLQLPEDAAMAMREAANYLLQSPKFSQKDVLEILQTCSRLCTEISNQELLSKLHNHVGLHYAEIRCFREAELHFFKALKLCTGKYFTVQKRAVLLQNLGAVHNAQEQFEKSLLYHSEAADMYGALGERIAQAQCLYNLATAHSQLKSYHTAEFYYRRALASFAEAGNIAKLMWKQAPFNPDFLAEDPIVDPINGVYRKSGLKAEMYPYYPDFPSGGGNKCVPNGCRGGNGVTHCMAQAYEGIGATQLSLDYFDLATSSYKQALRLFEKSKEASEIPCERIQAKLADVVNLLCSHHEGSADPAADRRSQEGLHQ